MCLQDQSYTLTKTNNVVLNKDNPISSTVRVVFAVGFSSFFLLHLVLFLYLVIVCIVVLIAFQCLYFL